MRAQFRAKKTIMKKEESRRSDEIKKYGQPIIKSSELTSDDRKRAQMVKELQARNSLKKAVVDRRKEIRSESIFANNKQ